MRTLEIAADDFLSFTTTSTIPLPAGILHLKDVDVTYVAPVHGTPFFVKVGSSNPVFVNKILLSPSFPPREGITETIEMEVGFVS